MTGNNWNPDPTVANASDCGAGDEFPANDANNTEATIVLNGITFEEWDKDDGSVINLTDEGFHVTGAKTGGFWYWDATESLAEGNDLFALVLKDGGVPGVDTKWAWFILDNPLGAESTWLTSPITAGNCASDAGAPAAGTYTHCGTWSMYGQNGNLKDVSHVSLYGADTLEETPTPPTGVPEPGTLLLLGLGVAGAGLAVRRRKPIR